MKLLSLTPMIWTKEIDETILFYTSILKFTCVEKNAEWGWAVMHYQNIEFMIAHPNEHIPFDKPIFTGTFYFKTDNVDDLWIELKDKANIVYEIDNFEYGMREFAIYDNNGYVLQFGQEIE